MSYIVKGTTIAEELARRSGLTRKVVELFLAHPGIWMGPHEIASVGGFSAWRSRLVEAREIVKLDGYVIEWNRKNGSETAYMLRPERLGRDAGDLEPRTWTTDGPFTEDFRLKP